MSRLRRYKDALISGYGVLGANILYTLASVPLALAYLSKSEFGMWALTMQIAGYVALVDLGMSGAVARILIDHKDSRENGAYGSVVVTANLVGLVQGLLVLFAGCGLSLVAGPLLRVPPSLQREFVGLMMGLSAVQAVGFGTRVFSLILNAHQRNDVLNWSQTAIVALNYGTLWLGFSLGWGVYSLLLAQAIVQIATLASNIWWCVHLKFMPARGQWGRPTWELFTEIFSFGKDVFLYSVGYQLLSASQTVFITRALGLDLAATWSVCSRMYFLVSQVILRVFDYSYPALSEMVVRGETEKVARRFKSIAVLSFSLGMVGAALLAICNQPFVTIWSHGRFRWSLGCDLMLSALLPIIVLARTHIGFIGVTKDFRFLRYLYLCEGVFFAGLSLPTMSRLGIGAMIAASIIGSLTFSLPYGLLRTTQYFRLRHWTTVLGWYHPGLRVGVFLLPIAVGIWWITRSVSAPFSLCFRTLTIGIAAGLVFWKKGFDDSLKAELKDRLQTRWPLIGNW
jgi:O-antigen/teichoic acid export membrane protein